MFKFDVHVHVHQVSAKVEADIINTLSVVGALIDTLNRRMQLMARTLDEVLADVRSEKTMIASLSALVVGLRKQVQDALDADGEITPETQAKIDAIFDAAEENKADLTAAVTAGVPDAPTGTGTTTEPGATHDGPV